MEEEEARQRLEESGLGAESGVISHLRVLYDDMMDERADMVAEEAAEAAKLKLEGEHAFAKLLC